MQIIQETRTIIKAEDGKVLRKKTTGRVVGDTVHLGYDYYEAGILLKEPHLAKPDDYEEVDLVEVIDADGNVTHEFPKEDDFKRLHRMMELVGEERKNINNQKFSATEMLALKRLYPVLNVDIKEGDEVKKGFKFQHVGELWVVLQDHTILPYYFPNENTSKLYLKITEDYIEEETDSLID